MFRPKGFVFIVLLLLRFNVFSFLNFFFKYTIWITVLGGNQAKRIDIFFEIADLCYEWNVFNTGIFFYEFKFFM